MYLFLTMIQHSLSELFGLPKNWYLFFYFVACSEYYWANYATGLGASLHELGHTFDLAHTKTGIMARGFDDIHRVFTVQRTQNASNEREYRTFSRQSSPRMLSLADIEGLPSESHARQYRDTCYGSPFRKVRHFLFLWKNEQFIKMFLFFPSIKSDSKSPHISKTLLCILAHFTWAKVCPVSWDRRICQLLLCRWVRPTPMNVLDMKLNSNTGALGNVEYLFIAITPRSTLARRGST